MDANFTLSQLAIRGVLSLAQKGTNVTAIQIAFEKLHITLSPNL